MAVSVPPVEDLRAILTYAGQARCEAERDRAAIMADTRQAVQVAHKHRLLSITEMAELTGLTRPTIYAMVQQEKEWT